MGVAAATLAGQYLGLGDPHRARRAVLLCWAASAAFMGLMGAVFIAVPEVLVRVLTNAAPLVDLAPMPIRICGFMQVFLATQIVLGSALRGAGDTRTTMWITIVLTLLVRTPLAYVAGIVLDLGLNGVWVAISAEVTLRACILGARFLGGGWTKVRV
jgi:Na+-driven multidrug efflux pump